MTFLYKILNEHVAVSLTQLDLVLSDRPVRGSVTKQRLKNSGLLTILVKSIADNDTNTIR